MLVERNSNSLRSCSGYYHATARTRSFDYKIIRTEKHSSIISILLDSVALILSFASAARLAIWSLQEKEC